MKNEINNTFYACPYCKEEYTNPVDLAHCILSCEEKRKKEEEQKKAEKMADEKEARYKEIVDARNNYLKLISNYTKDYGSLIITTDTHDWEQPFMDYWWFR